jgi:5-methylcytosine-specific restriction endonuclease McrA
MVKLFAEIRKECHRIVKQINERLSFEYEDKEISESPKILSRCDACNKKFDAVLYYDMAHEDHLEGNLEVLRESYGGVSCSDECAEVLEEMKKMKESEARSRIRSKAEKRLYGKVKTKKRRVPLSKELRDRVYRKHNHQCLFCSQKQGLHIHHKDHDPKNNAMRNLLLLCGVCHKKLHMKVR